MVSTKLVSVMNTGFRDGFQSCFGARVFTPDFLPAVEAARDAGFTHFEAGGGARYQALYLYCGEDAFDMMDSFRVAAGPDANLQTLARGVNVVGLDSQSSDVIDLHAKMFKKHGMTTIRNFDALNDVRNLSYSGKCITDAGLKHEVVVTLMELPPGAEGMYQDGDREIPAHSPEFYISVLRQILDAEVPFDSVCFKDASGTVVPSKVYDTIKAARALLGDDVHLRVHTHETAGISVMTYKAALDAGADGIDLGLAPCSGGTAQPDVVTMWHALRGTRFDLGLDIRKVLEAEEVFKECMSDYFMPPEALAVEPVIPFSPMPGGALTANTAMLRDNNMLDKYPAVIAAMGEVVRRGGFGTSVTPVSQFYFQQAFNNVIFGPWKRIADGYGKMVLGYFGRTPVPPDPEIVALAQEQLGREPTTENPREINDADPTKGIPVAQGLLKQAGLEITDETTFIAAALGAKGIRFLQGDFDIGVRKNVAQKAPVATQPDSYTVTVNGKRHTVRMDGGAVVVDGTTYQVDLTDGDDGDSGAATASAGVPITAEMPGKVFKVVANVGDLVAEGDTVVVLEALKMEIPVGATGPGRISEIHVAVGEQVAAGARLVTLSEH
jgi:pyruvate carboxylase subunit B